MKFLAMPSMSTSTTWMASVASLGTWKPSLAPAK